MEKGIRSKIEKKGDTNGKGKKSFHLNLFSFKFNNYVVKLIFRINKKEMICLKLPRRR